MLLFLQKCFRKRSAAASLYFPRIVVRDSGISAERGEAMNEQAKSFRILSEAITGSDCPADNLLCLSNILGYLQFSIPICSRDGFCISESDAEGISYILSLIEHDLRALSEVTELKIEEQFIRNQK
jgi:hypothetical protein